MSRICSEIKGGKSVWDKNERRSTMTASLLKLLMNFCTRLKFAITKSIFEKLSGQSKNEIEKKTFHLQ